MRSSVQVSAAARLHFGLAGLSRREGPSFGGLGMMIDRPRAIIHIEPALRWPNSRGACDRCLAVCRRAHEAWDRRREMPAVACRVIQRMPMHCGLGTGTQIAFAAAAGMRALLDLPPAPTDRLAHVAGRGARSAVGAHGFAKGGLIWETGRMPGDQLGHLAQRVAVPAAWRVVLAIPQNEEGLSGPAETAAFAKLPSPAPGITHRLRELAEQAVIPAVRSRDFEGFSTAVFDYCRLSGSMFAPVQGGDYASSKIAARVEALRKAGVSGVGQSSWGPTVFALQPDRAAASELVATLQKAPEFADCEFIVAAAENNAAEVTVGAPAADYAAS